MARYLDASCRLCRRQGQKLFLKGLRCTTDKCAVEKRSYAPGQHGKRRVKLQGYGLQLNEKRKVKRFYGVSEKQFRHYFATAERKKGITGENLLQLLERRLDNVVYRLGMAASRTQARQLITHGHMQVNGRKVSAPSYLTRAEDVVAYREKSRKSPLISENIAEAGNRGVPEWLEFQPEQYTGTIKRIPERADVDLPVQEQLIVELYSR